MLMEVANGLQVDGRPSGASHIKEIVDGNAISANTGDNDIGTPGNDKAHLFCQCKKVLQ